MEFLQDRPELLAIAIFLARILDVSIGTLRTILIIRGYRIGGSVLGFLEVLIWVTASAQVIMNLDAWYLVLAYAGGFAVGNYVGSWLESRLALGAEIVRAISKDPRVKLKERIGQEHFGVVELAGRATDGAPVEVLLVVEARRRVPRLIELIHDTDPEAVCSISDVRIPAMRMPRPARLPAILGGWRNWTIRK
jgi:uncharacterized protein YebE (UPF0316 family)